MNEKFEDGYLVKRSTYKIGQHLFVVDTNLGEAKVYEGELIDMDWWYEGDIIYFFKVPKNNRLKIEEYDIFESKEEAERWAENLQL